MADESEMHAAVNRGNAAKRKSWSSSEGQAYPLGATLVPEDGAVNFAIYSKHATDVTLLLFAPDQWKTPIQQQSLDFLKHKTGRVWHCRVPLDQLGGARYYGYLVDGPDPEPGFLWHCFDRDKLLLDPYARAVFFPPGFDRNAACQPGSNLGQAALGVLPQRPKSKLADRPGRPRHEHDLIIYEMHVRGVTAHSNSGVPALRRGTYLGVIEKIPYLRQLGVTAVELMPVFQFEPDQGNYWGYMPLSFFAPHVGYATPQADCDPLEEFRAMVDAFHQAGIEVILDVVFNHTCEQGADGPVYSLKGIDNSTYYMIDPDQEDPFVNFSGTGNTLHTVNAATRQMIVDSLRYWAQEMRVDGFRFDLASIFTRHADGTINLDDPPIFSQISAEDDLEGIRFIAEPWDAVGTRQLGKTFPGRSAMQWNSDFRDTIQRFVRGDDGQVPDLMTRIYGSADHFPDDRMHAYRPVQSVNYITSHDGMTLYDLFAYETRNNWANGHQNRDGPIEYRCNCGYEGDEDVPSRVKRLRNRLVKNSFALLMLSNGTPMFRMGDEFMQTQRGNSNPYNQDNETSWLDWSRLEDEQATFRFFAGMIEFRKRHPSISRSRFWRDDVSWYGSAGEPDLSRSSKTLAWCLHGRSQQDDDLYVMVNGQDCAVQFEILEGEPGQWLRMVDTSQDSPLDVVDRRDARPIGTLVYDLDARSVVVLLRPMAIGGI